MYELARDPQDITFRDVVAAGEGKAPLFQCVEIRQKEILLDMSNLPEAYTQAKGKIPEENAKKTIEWFNNTKARGTLI